MGALKGVVQPANKMEINKNINPEAAILVHFTGNFSRINKFRGVA
jgi:hypothetical protein